MDELARRLQLLRIAHGDLDDAISALIRAPIRDELQMARLKRRKLRLKDEIAQTEDMMVPDIIA